MAARAHKTEDRPSGPAAKVGMADGHAPVSSPARALQDRLAAALVVGSPEPHVRRWPPVVRMALPVALSGVLWTAIIAGVRALLTS